MHTHFKWKQFLVYKQIANERTDMYTVLLFRIVNELSRID